MKINRSRPSWSRMSAATLLLLTVGLFALAARPAAAQYEYGNLYAGTVTINGSGTTLSPGAQSNGFDPSSSTYGFVDAYNQSHVNLGPGAVLVDFPSLNLSDQSTATITGGSMASLVTSNTSSATMSAGSAYFTATADTSHQTYTGGTFHTVQINDAGVVTITGGQYTYLVNDSTTGAFNIYGYDLKLVPVNGFFPTITGFLQNGTPIDATYFGPATGFLNLINVPEPSPGAVLLLGGLAVALLFWRVRKQSEQSE